jgi:hypothetical protein
MSSSIDQVTNPALPTTTTNSRNGLTKRDYFAVAILQGLLAGRGPSFDQAEDVAQAIKMADKLIVGLSK